MALINCPECQKEISDKAITCPNCGNPLNAPKELIYPNLPPDLGVGKRLDKLFYEYKISFRQSENILASISEGDTSLILCENGISIKSGPFNKPFDLHKLQIISVAHATQQELIKTPHSVIGRAIAGNLILGPLGAIIGGMSAIMPSEKVKEKVYIVINYWDTNTHTAQTLLLQSDEFWTKEFITDYQKILINGEKKPELKGCGPAILIFLIGLSTTMYLILTT